MIYGTYQKNLYFNPEQGQAGFLLKPMSDTLQEYIGENGCIKVVGRYCLQQYAIPLAIEGEWKLTEYGYEYHISDVSLGATTPEDAELFLSELDIVISPRNIKKILDVTGPDIFAAAENPNIETEICSKTGAECISIIEVFTKLRHFIREMQLFKMLSHYNGTYNHCIKILKKFPDDAIEVLKTDAYRILSEVKVPFQMIDKIALDMGVDIFSESRIQAMLLWTIRKQSSNGNVYITLDDLCKTVSRNYGDVPKTAIIAALENHPYIVHDDAYPDAYYEINMLKDEKIAAKEFARIMYSRTKLPFHPEYISQIETEMGHNFGSQQKEAFFLLQTTGVKLLTGDPGTGKTTTVNGLLRYLEILWMNEFGHQPTFGLCAPSGRAAQRMKETTHRNSLTVHKIIEYQPYGNSEYFKDGNDPIDADIIVVDEVSMLGLSTFCKLLGAIKSGSLVILVGDANQLPSVEPGNVLQDIIDSGYVDRCHLSEIFRQAEESYINLNAKKILNGDEELLEGDDFRIFPCTPDETPDILSSITKSLLSEYDANKIQVITPVKKGSCGVKQGNVMLQDIFNPGKGGIWYGYRNYRLNDRVITLSNNYNSGYFNGDIGYLQFISDRNINVKIGEESILLSREQYGDMELAYNCTVHKSQGSEYEILIIVLQNEAKGMLDRNLLYTAVTRGKRVVYTICEDDTLQTAIRTKRKNTRKSNLVPRIVNELHKLGW